MRRSPCDPADDRARISALIVKTRTGSRTLPCSAVSGINGGVRASTTVAEWSPANGAEGQFLLGRDLLDLAEHLLIQHHGAVQLVDRAAAAGLVTRRRDETDHRLVHVVLTDEGRRVLESLSARHLDELRRVGLSFSEISAGIDAGL